MGSIKNVIVRVQTIAESNSTLASRLNVSTEEKQVAGIEINSPVEDIAAVSKEKAAMQKMRPTANQLNELSCKLAQMIETFNIWTSLSEQKKNGIERIQNYILADYSIRKLLER